MSQLDEIIEILDREGKIDNFYCIQNRLTLRLGARIFDLKKRGWDFETEERPDKNTIYRVTKRPEAKQQSLIH